MLEVKDAYKELVDSEEFKKAGFLCGVFLMAAPESLEQTAWQFDFYDDKKDRITSYLTSYPVKIVNEESEVFKEEKTVVNELKLEEVKVSFEDAFKKANELLKKRSESTNKVIIVLQKSENLFWNISFITNTFNLLNVRVDAVNGKVLDEKFTSLLSFKAENSD